MNAGVNVLQFELGMAYILSKHQLCLSVKTVILIALLNVCHDGDAGKHSYILSILVKHLRENF